MDINSGLWFISRDGRRCGAMLRCWLYYKPNFMTTQDLITSCSVDLFECMMREIQYLHHNMISCFESCSDSLRLRGLNNINNILPTCIDCLHRRSFINRILFATVWYLLYCDCLILFTVLTLLPLLGINNFVIPHFIHSYSFIISCQNATKHELGDVINSRLFNDSTILR